MEVALLPDESHLPQLASDRLWLAGLLKSGPMDVRVVKHLTGMSMKRIRSALENEEWFVFKGRKWLLTSDGRREAFQG